MLLYSETCLLCNYSIHPVIHQVTCLTAKSCGEAEDRCLN